MALRLASSESLSRAATSAMSFPQAVLAPEPLVQVLFVGFLILLHAGFVEEGLEVVGAITDELVPGNAGRTFGHVGLVFSRSAQLEETDDATEPSLGNSAQAHSGPSTVVFNPAFVEGPHGRNFVGGAAGGWSVIRDYLGSLGHGGGRGIVGKVHQHWPFRSLEHVEGRTENLMLAGGVIWSAEGETEEEGYKERSGRLNLFGVLPDHGDGHGSDTVLFEYPGQHTHGVGAEGSSRGKKDDVHPFVFKSGGDLGPGLFDYAAGIPEGAHEGIETG